MARLLARARPDRERVLRPARQLCPGCGGHMRLRYENQRTLVTLTGPVRLRLKIRRCEREGCARYHKPYRPEAEGAMALPQHEFGLDVIALVGVLRHREHRSVPEIHASRCAQRGVAIAERSVTNLLDRYDELLAVSLTEGERLRGCWRAKAGSSWRWTACSRMWAMRCSGWCATVSRARCCLRAACCPAPRRTSRLCCAR